MTAQQDVVRIGQLVDRRSLAAIDLGPLESIPVVVMPLHQRAALPDTHRTAFESPHQCRPVVDVRGFAVAAVGSLCSRGKLRDRSADRGDRTEQVLGKIDPVNRHVVQVAGTSLVLVLTPTPTGLGQVEESLAAKMPRSTQSSLGQQVPEIPHRRSESVGKGGHVSHVGIPRRSVHPG